MAAPVELYFRPGQFIFREGEPSSCLYLVKKGTISVRKSKGAAFVEIARIYGNEVLGELSFFDRLPRSAAAVALTEVEVTEIRFDALDRVYAGIPDYLKTIISGLAERLRRADDVIRRLQKEVVKEPGAGDDPLRQDEPTATEALAATMNIMPELDKAGPEGASAGDPAPRAAPGAPAGGSNNAQSAATAPKKS